MNGSFDDTLAVPPRPVDAGPDTDSFAATLAASGAEDATDKAASGRAAAAGGRIPIHGQASRSLLRGALVGRYVVLGPLGAGGMGVVYAAYDPELNRRVALKLLRPDIDADVGSATATDARRRLLREAQALAKLSHPNVVAIHDVGEHAGAVWLAMEHVEGITLDAWSKQRRRTWREVLVVMADAGNGLVAAHAADLLHRDVKPDNIMIGDDGRVRVMDLGLARAVTPTGDGVDAHEVVSSIEIADLAALELRVTQTGGVLGTPAYMSPEQHEGRALDARSDVFSYCVTLWEALYGERPFAGATLAELATNVLDGRVRPIPAGAAVPAWLRRVCKRGLEVDPDARFATIGALLDALEQGRRRARMRLWAIGGVAFVALGASLEGMRRYDHSAKITQCQAEGAAIEEVWNDGVRAKLREGLVATQVSDADVTADKTTPYFDAQADAWRTARTDACLDTQVHGLWDDDLLRRSRWCLDERRMELDALAGELSRADDKVVYRAVKAAAGMSPVAACRDPVRLSRLPAPPDDSAAVDEVRRALSHSASLSAAGRYEDALATARQCVQQADAIGWPPLRAAARRLEGHVLGRLGANTDAEAASYAAYMQAAESESWDVAAAAAENLVFNVGYQQSRAAEGRMWADLERVAVYLAGDPEGLREAARSHNLGVVEHVDGRYDEARALLERALEIRVTALGSDHPDVASTINNLGVVAQSVGDHRGAIALYERALGISERALGSDHPDLAYALNNLAILRKNAGELEEAKALFARALHIQERTLGTEHLDFASALGNLANVHYVERDYASATPLYERALAIAERVAGPEHTDVAFCLHNLANVHRDLGDHTKARAMHERALAIREKALGHDHLYVAASRSSLGLLDLELGRAAEALPLLEAAVSVFDAHPGTQADEASARFALARALVQVGRDRQRALVEAHRAAEGFRELEQTHLPQFVELEAFIATHAAPP